MVSVHGRPSNYPAQSPLSPVLKHFPHFIYFKNQSFCADLSGGAKASLFTVEEIRNKQPCPQTPLAPSNQLPVEHKSAQWKTNKQRKKPQTVEQSHFGGGNKSFYLQRPELERFFKWAKTHCSLGTERKPGAPGTRDHFPHLPGQRKRLL